MPDKHQFVKQGSVICQTLYIADLQILKDNGILQAVIIPSQKFSVTLIEKSETKEDGTSAPDKLVQQEWTRNQLINYFQIQHNKILTHALRSFQGLVQAHAARTITNIDDLKIQLQELREIPYQAYASLKKHGGITTEYIADLMQITREQIAQHETAGLTHQQALAQPSNYLEGISLGEMLTLQPAAEARRDSAAHTTEGHAKGITQGASVEYGAINLTRADGSILIAYVAGRADVNDILEDLLEAHLKHTITTTNLTYNQLADTIKEIEKHLPDTTLLPANKSTYTKQDIVEAYSKLALAHYLYNEQYLPITQGGHKLLREIGRAVDTARLFKNIGDAWHTYANSEPGKQHLATTGATFADLLRTSGFKVGTLVAQARATAEQTAQVIAGRDWQPPIEQELDTLLENIQAEEQLAEINQQEAAQPTTIPASESITGQEIVIQPTEASAPEITQGDAIIRMARAKSNAQESLNNAERSRQEAEKARKEYKKHLAAYKRLQKKHEARTWKNKQEADYKKSELEASLEYAESFKQDIERAEADIQFWQEKARRYHDEAEKMQSVVDSLKATTPTTSEDTTVEPEPRSSGEASLGVERPKPGSDEAGPTSTPASTPTQEDLRQRFEQYLKLRLASGKKDKKTKQPSLNSLTLVADAAKRIRKSRASARDYAIYFRSNPFTTEALAIEQGIYIRNQNGETSPAYTLGRFIADRFTEPEYNAYTYGILTNQETEAIIASRTDEGIIREAKELTPSQLPQSAKWPTLPRKQATPQQQKDTIIKALFPFASKDKTRYVINTVHHTISNGVETYVATDLHRLIVIRRQAPEGSTEINETLDKNGNPVNIGDRQYPNWQKVMIPATGNGGIIDLAPLRFAEKITEKTRKVETSPELYEKSRTRYGRIVYGEIKKYTTETYIPAEKWPAEGEGRHFHWQHDNKLLKFAPAYIRDAIKLLSTLGKTTGAPSTVSVTIGQGKQMLWHSEHNGWTVDHLLMPIPDLNSRGHEFPTTFTKGDILLNPAPTAPSTQPSMSLIGPSAKTWNNYTDRVFYGLYDGMPRVELDSSKFKFLPASQRGVHPSEDDFRDNVEETLNAVFEIVYTGNFDSLKQKISYIQSFLDFYAHGAHIDRDAAKKYLQEHDVYNKNAIGDFIFNQKPYSLNLDFGKVWVLSQVLDAPELYAAYPQLKQVPVHFVDLGENAPNGRSWGNSIEINENENRRPFNRRKTLLHEIQHLIQLHEGFARGSNAARAYADFQIEYQRARETAKMEGLLERRIKPDGIKTLPHEKQNILKRYLAFKDIHDHFNDNPGKLTLFLNFLTDGKLGKYYTSYDVYKLSAGEAEARTVAKRADLTEEERHNKPFNESLDIPVEQAIVRFNQAQQNTLSEHGTSGPTTAAQTSGIFTDGVLETENAIITEPGFSIKAATPGTLERFTVDPLGERIIHHIRTESRRYARLLGDKTPYQQAVNAAHSAAAIIAAGDKHLQQTGRPVPARYRHRLQKLRTIAEKYAQIIAGGTPRSFNKISPQEKEELETAIAELEAQEQDAAMLDPDRLLTDSDRLTKRERTARQKEHHRAIVREAAKGRVYATLAAMLDTAADALDSYLKASTGCTRIPV